MVTTPQVLLDALHHVGLHSTCRKFVCILTVILGIREHGL